MQRGHRESVDIDLFTDAEYDSVNFEAIDKFLRNTYPYVETNNYKVIGMGKPYFVGKNKLESIKLDVFYTEKFIQRLIQTDGIRLASVEEIIAMKLDVISRGGRKKDFWDIHELIKEYSLNAMLSLHEQRYPYSHNAKEIKKQFINFANADEDNDPICLRKKIWEVIKLEIIDFVKR